MQWYKCRTRKELQNLIKVLNPDNEYEVFVVPTKDGYYVGRDSQRYTIKRN